MLPIVLHVILVGIPSLHDILVSHKSDKAHHHEYDKAYEPIFDPLRRQPISILEIGVEDGHSMASWAEYFAHPNTRIVGLAYQNKLKESLNDKRMHIVYGNQNDPTVQKELASRGNYTIIIDDGSHLPSHQWNTFSALWPFVSPGGLYIVEDIETNYWSTKASIYGNTFASEHNVMDKFKNIIDTAVNAEFSTGVDSSDVESVRFHRNCIIFRKQGFGHKRRAYRMRNKLNGKRLPS